LLALLALLAAGCSSIGYLTHVSAGQLRMLWDRERLSPELIASLAPEEQRGLAAIERARGQAAALGLEPSTSYRHLIPSDATHTVHVVVASPPDRLEAVTWFFPIVGRIAYRGYFDPERARTFAAGLEREGYDTYVRPASLYSTLGYFDDPVPRDLLAWPEMEIYDVIIHELVHGTIFIRDDVAYNEALASFIAEHAALELLASEPQARDAARRMYDDMRLYTDLIERLARDLEALYAASTSKEQALAERAELFARYQSEVYPSLPWQTEQFKGFREVALSNAFVVAQRTYSGDVPCFEAELAALQGDLRAFIRAHRERPVRHVEIPACAPPAQP
jgi:predicted aminopeptidase